MSTWARAWHDALYGEDGFYRRAEGPSGHFETATHGPVGRALATTLLGLAHDAGAHAVVDVGAGRGELLHALRDAGHEGPLVGVDVVERPADLEPVSGWVRSPGGAALPSARDVEDALGAPLNGALVVAHEWLDVVPCVVAQVDDAGSLREVHVDPDGTETLGEGVGADDLAWAQRWWPAREPGQRVEVGRARDDAWSGMLDAWRPRAAVAVDYGHVRSQRPESGTLSGYRDGAVTAPTPDGSCDVTAHVAVDSLRHDELVMGADAVRRWGPSATSPEHDMARRDPVGYLDALARASAAGALLGPPYGDFWWVVARG